MLTRGSLIRLLILQGGCQEKTNAVHSEISIYLYWNEWVKNNLNRPMNL